MTTQDYKQSIKQLIDSVDNELLLKHWKKQLEHDLQHMEAIELTVEEWSQVQEGIADYNNGDVVSLEDLKNRL